MYCLNLLSCVVNDLQKHPKRGRWQRRVTYVQSEPGVGRWGGGRYVETGQAHENGSQTHPFPGKLSFCGLIASGVWGGAATIMLQAQPQVQVQVQQFRQVSSLGRVKVYSNYSMYISTSCTTSAAQLETGKLSTGSVDIIPRFGPTTTYLCTPCPSSVKREFFFFFFRIDGM